jgi:hypothetical protein
VVGGVKVWSRGGRLCSPLGAKAGDAEAVPKPHVGVSVPDPRGLLKLWVGCPTSGDLPDMEFLASLYQWGTSVGSRSSQRAQIKAKPQHCSFIQ